MSRFLKKRNKTTGLPPGSLVYVGDKETEKINISIIDYGINDYKEKTLEKIEDGFSDKKNNSIRWINIDGIHNVENIEKIGKFYSLHPLLLEDILNTGQRPKMEDYEDHIFVVLKMLSYNNKNSIVESEQVSLVFGKNYVVSFQEKPGDVFDSIRNRIRNDKGRIRKMGSDYLVYALIDAIVDNFFIILEKIGDEIESLEDELVSNPSTETLQTIHSLKRELIFIRKSVWPLRELIAGLQRSESKIIHKSTLIYFRDVYDHTIHVIDTVETFRDMISGVLDIYLSSISNKMNEVMKVLTIFAAIFIPLTFVAGVYGMNFNPDRSPFSMPELNFYWGYPLTLISMLLISSVLLFYFKKKKWL